MITQLGQLCIAGMEMEMEIHYMRNLYYLKIVFRNTEIHTSSIYQRERERQREAWINIYVNIP